MREKRTNQLSGQRRQKRLAALLAAGALAVAAGLALLPTSESGASAPVDQPKGSAVTTSLPATLSADAGVTTEVTSGAPVIGSTPVTTEPSPAAATATTLYQHPVEHPVRIVIPAMDLDATVIEVGLLQNGDMEVPRFGLVGWYKLGPTPGASGPAVIVGHVDTKSGRDVFYHLKNLEAGDEVYVYGEDGDMATFTVDSKEQQLKSELPTEKIWGDTADPVIRLITCGGDFDRRSRHYLSNVIVYGHLVK